MTDIAEQIADAIQRTRETTGTCTRSDLRCWGFTEAEIEAHAPYDDPPLHPRSAERILREQAAEIERLRADKAALVEALEPFAKASASWRRMYGDDKIFIWKPSPGDGIMVNDLRAAVAALEKVSKP